MRYKRLAVNDEQKVYDRCDKLYPQLRHNRLCRSCAERYIVRPAEHIHHIIPRSNPLTRFYLPNLYPVCAECHAAIHAGKLKPAVSETLMDELRQLANRNLLSLCITRGITRAEYFEDQLQKIKDNIL